MSAADVSWVEDLFAAQFLVAVFVLSSAMAAGSFWRSRAVAILRFARSPMFRLLRRLRLSPWAYTRQTPTFLFEAQLRNCEGCFRRGDCAEVLRRTIPVKDLGFCLNGSAIVRFWLGAGERMI